MGRRKNQRKGGGGTGTAGWRGVTNSTIEIIPTADTNTISTITNTHQQHERPQTHQHQHQHQHDPTSRQESTLENLFAAPKSNACHYRFVFQPQTAVRSQEKESPATVLTSILQLLMLILTPITQLLLLISPLRSIILLLLLLRLQLLQLQLL